MPSAHIALVDDDRLVLESLGDCLAAAGFVVSRFRSGEAALTELWKTPVDLLVVDLLLPGMSGFDLAEELRGRPQCQRMPVLAISALTWGEKLARHPAIDDVLAKPVEPETLLFTVRALLAASASRSDAAVAVPWPAPTRAATATATGRARLEVRLSSALDCVTEYGQNLAHDGLFIRAYDPLPPESQVEVALSLPFLAQPAVLQGRVVRTVPLESADARLSGPGMGIALSNVPKELKLALKAYVAGVRDGSSLQPASGPRSRRVLLAGLDARLPGDVGDFLTRAGVRVARASRLGEAFQAIDGLRPEVAIVALDLLGASPAQAIAAMRERGARDVVVVATEADQAAALAGRCELIEEGDDQRLFDALCLRLGVARRSSERVRWVTSVATMSAEGRVEAALEDLSLGGLLMSTPRGLAVGERLYLEFVLPEEGRVSGLGRAVRVTRMSPEDPRLRVGVAFERLDDDSPERLRRFIQARAGTGSVLH